MLVWLILLLIFVVRTRLPVQVIAWRTVSEMTCNVSSGMLNLTHSLTHSVHVESEWMQCEWYVNTMWMVCEYNVNGMWIECEWYVMWNVDGYVHTSEAWTSSCEAWHVRHPNQRRRQGQDSEQWQQWHREWVEFLPAGHWYTVYIRTVYDNK